MISCAAVSEKRVSFKVAVGLCDELRGRWERAEISSMADCPVQAKWRCPCITEGPIFATCLECCHYQCD